MNGGYTSSKNNSGPQVKPLRLYSRVTKKPIKNAPQSSNKNTSTPKTTPPVFPNIPQFRTGKSKPLPMSGRTTAK